MKFKVIAISGFVAIVLAAIFFDRFSEALGSGIVLDELSTEPEQIRQIAKHIQRIPKGSTKKEFGANIEKIGLNAEAPFWKDFEQRWAISPNGEEPPFYILGATFKPANGVWGLTDAKISRVDTRGGASIPIWRMVYR